VINFDKLSASNILGTPNLRQFFDQNPSKTSVLVSDDEPQFVVRLEFTEHVELTNVVLRADSKPQNADHLYPPKELWFLANLDAEVDFEDLNDNCDINNYDKKKKFGFVIENPEQLFQEHGELTIGFPAARFKNVTKLTVFFKMNANNDGDGEDTSTFLNHMRFVGKPSGNKDISAWEPCKS